jgi:hypothetical protein
MNYPTVI